MSEPLRKKLPPNAYMRVTFYLTSEQRTKLRELAHRREMAQEKGRAALSRVLRYYLERHWKELREAVIVHRASIRRDATVVQRLSRVNLFLTVGLVEQLRTLAYENSVRNDGVTVSTSDVVRYLLTMNLQ